MNKIICLCGLKSNGKDTVANYIIKNYDNWEKDSFAGTLKDAVAAIFGWDRKMLAGDTPEDREIRETKDEYWSKKFGYDVTPRIILQKFGTECLRNHLHEDIWVDSLERKIINTDKNVIITDCRFKNELDMLRNLGATIIRVERNPLPEWFKKVEEIGKLYYNGAHFLVDPYQQIDEIQNIHRSEWDWIGYDNPDFIINTNDGDFEGMYKQIDKIMENING